MLRFEKPPDVVFQAILRDSFNFTIDLLDDLIGDNDGIGADARKDMKGFIADAAKVFPPALAKTTLINLRNHLDRPEVYYLNDYHYLLIYDVLSLFADIHNDMVAESKTGKDKKEAAFVDPFYIEYIDFNEIIELYFYDIDFLFGPDVLLNLSEKERAAFAFNDELFALSQGLLPHPEELKLKVHNNEDPDYYKIGLSNYFGPNSKMYPDYDYYYTLYPDSS